MNVRLVVGFLVVLASACASRTAAPPASPAAETGKTTVSRESAPVVARPAYGAAALAEVVDYPEVVIAPDASEIGFVSDRSGSLELWTAKVANGVVGTPVQRTKLKEQVHGLTYSVNGDLLFLADKGGDERPDLWMVKHGESEPKVIAETKLAEEMADFSPDGKRIAYVADPDRPFRFNVMVRDLASGKTTQLTKEPVNVYDPTWSADGKTIVATVTPDDQKGELLVIDVASKKVRRIKPLRKDGILEPVDFLPSGLLLATTVNDKGFSQMCTVDLASAKIELVGPGDWDVEKVAVSRKDGTVLFTRNVRGESELIAIRGVNWKDWSDRKNLNTLSTDGVIGALDADQTGEWAAFTRENARRPAEIFLARPLAGSMAVAVGADSGKVDLDRLAKAQLREFTSFDGMKLDAYTWTPPVSRLGTPPPAIVKVHGGPNGQTRPVFSPEIQSLVEAGFVVISPNYRGSTGYGRAFEDANNMDWGGSDLKDLIAVVDTMAKEGSIDSERVGIAGGSYGGYMTLRAITATPDRWAAGVESYGMPDLVQDYEITVDRFGTWYETEMGTPRTHAALFKDRSPVHSLDKVRAPLLVLQGENDTNVPRVESDLVVNALKKRGSPVEYVIYPNEGHGFTHRENRLDSMTRTTEFFVRHLGKRKSGS